MRDYKLGFISNENIYKHVKDTIDKYGSKNITLKEFQKNIPDPIKLTFDYLVYGTSIDKVIEKEVIRQTDKSNTNHIGYFHQNIFHYIGRGWQVPKKGFDIINENLLYYVEMKNKHNTMNSSSAKATFEKMYELCCSNPQAKCFLVEVIADHSQDINWRFSLNGKDIDDMRIRRISIDKFYELVTGEQDAFKKLCEVLPLVIQDVISENSSYKGTSSVIEELKNLGNPNLLEQLYKKSFETYNGFSDFKLPFLDSEKH